MKQTFLPALGLLLLLPFFAAAQNLGIHLTTPATEALQIGEYNNSNNYKILIPGVYNFEQMKLGQFGNGASGIEFVNHTSTTQSYGIRLSANVDQSEGFQIQYATRASEYSALQYRTGFSIGTNGYVGIGTTTPFNLLNLDPKGNGGITIGNPNTGSGGYTSMHVNISADKDGYGELQVIKSSGNSWGDIVMNLSGGNVGIGTNQTGDYKLAVEGTIGARRVKVSQGSWADFVFHPDYKLPSLQDVENYIAANKHLSGIPTEEEVKKEGIDLGEINEKLLQKVEELTLYLIDQQKQITQLKQQNELLLKLIQIK